MRSSRHTVSAVAGVVAVVIVAWTGGSAASAFRAAPVHLPGVAMPAAPTAAAPNGPHEQLLNAYANLPVAFVENRGQIDARVRYYAQGPRYAFYLTRDELVLSFMNAEPANKRRVAIVAAVPRGQPPGRAGRRTRTGRGQLLPRQRSGALAQSAPPLRTDRVSRALAGSGPEPARAGRDAEVRVPGAAWARGSRTSVWPTAGRTALRWTTRARC